MTIDPDRPLHDRWARAKRRLNMPDTAQGILDYLAGHLSNYAGVTHTAHHMGETMTLTLPWSFGDVAGHGAFVPEAAADAFVNMAAQAKYLQESAAHGVMAGYNAKMAFLDSIWAPDDPAPEGGQDVPVD